MRRNLGALKMKRVSNMAHDGKHYCWCVKCVGLLFACSPNVNKLVLHKQRPHRHRDELYGMYYTLHTLSVFHYFFYLFSLMETITAYLNLNIHIAQKTS